MKLQISSMPKVAMMMVLAVSVLSFAAENSPPTQGTVPLSYGVPDVLKLAQAKLGDDVIVSYIQNRGLSYSDLGSSEIVYLHQQGVSPRVITTMLDQRTRLSGAATQTVARRETVTPATTIASGQTAAIAPVQYAPQPAAYVQSSPTVIVMRDSSPRLVDYGIYPAHTYYPGSYYHSYRGASFSFGFRGGYYGGDYRAGYSCAPYPGGGHLR